MKMRSAPPPAPATHDLHTVRVVLRDGSVASVRPSTPGDLDAIRGFFHDLSPESRQYRFFGMGEPPIAVLDRLADSSGPRQALTLIALRHVEGAARIIAVASYPAVAVTAAEVSRCTPRHGFLLFHASMLEDNDAMREVFRDSGFAVQSTSDGGVVEWRTPRLSIRRHPVRIEGESRV